MLVISNIANKTINNKFITKLYNKLPIDTNLIEEQIKYLNKNGITDKNIEKVLNEYNNKKMIEMIKMYRFIKYKVFGNTQKKF